MINICNLSGLEPNQAMTLAMGLSAVQAPYWIRNQTLNQVISGIRDKTPDSEQCEARINRAVENIACILAESLVRFKKPIQISRDLLNQSLNDTMDEAKTLVLAEASGWERDQNLAEAMGIVRAKASDRDKGEFEAENIAKAIDEQTREILNLGELDLLHAIDQAIGLARAKAPVQLQDSAREKAKSIIRAMISDENGGEVIAQIIDKAVQVQAKVLKVETDQTTTPVSMSAKNGIDLAMSLAALQAPVVLRDLALSQVGCFECATQTVDKVAASAQARFQAPVQIPEDLQNRDLSDAWLRAVDYQAPLLDRDQGLAEALAIVRAKASNLDEGEVKATALAESVDKHLRRILGIKPDNMLYAVDLVIALARAKAPTLVQDKARAKVIYIARSIFRDRGRDKMIMMVQTMDKAIQKTIDKVMQQDQTGVVKGGN